MASPDPKLTLRGVVIRPGVLAEEGLILGEIAATISIRKRANIAGGSICLNGNLG
jgi:hypothetical protein